MIFLKEVLDKKQLGKRMLLGVDGLSGSGKTTFVKQLQSELETYNTPSVVLHLDNLIVERKKRYGTGYEEWYEHYGLQWDVASLTEKVFRSWARGDARLELDVYDAKTDSVTQQTMYVPADCILIVEAVYLQRKEWRDFFDLVLYIDCPRSIRFERVTKRDGQDILDQARIELYQRRYWAAEDHYLATETPKERADLIWELTE